jgi:hypothetical protein
MKNHLQKTKESIILETINDFSENQTLSMVGRLRNLEVGLKILKNNKWERLNEYSLPFERFIPLYDQKYNICDLGIY